MQIPIIKKLVEKYSLKELQAAEEAIAEGEEPTIEIEGVDEGERLTHAFAAFWIKEKMEEEDMPLNKALRAYTEMVRNSIN
jgi:hypothetical protein